MASSSQSLGTLLSRAVYQRGTAVVSTEKPSGGVIAHTVEVMGKIVENQELAVNTGRHGSGP